MEESNKESKQAITALAKVEQLSFDGAQPSGHILRMEDIGTPQNNRLDKQWFQAEYKSDSNGKGYVSLALTGNPNDKNHNFDLPNVAFGTSEKYTNYRVLSTKSDTGYSLALFDLVESK